MEEIKNLDHYPRKSNAHLWADYIEMICLSTSDKIATFHEIERATTALDATSEDSEILDGIDAYGMHSSSMRPLINDRIENLVNEGIEHIRHRVITYGDGYPFFVNDDGTEIKLHYRLSEDMKIYLAILFCANHKYLSGERLYKELTTGFEIICFHTLKSMLPDDGQVRLIGTTHSADTIPGNVDAINPLSNHKTAKFDAMALDIGTVPTYDPDDYSSSDSGESGSDLLAWLPFQESVIPNEIVIVGQCATSKMDWPSKQGDACPHKWSKILGLKVNSINMLFIAASPRKNNGRFDTSKERVSNAIWLDRQRIYKRLVSWLSKNSESANSYIPESVYELIASVSSTP